MGRSGRCCCRRQRRRKTSGENRREARSSGTRARSAGDDDVEDVIGLALRAAATNSGVAARPVAVASAAATAEKTNEKGEFAPLFARLCCCCSRPVVGSGHAAKLERVARAPGIRR
ncbi:hypothetical protein MRX96_026877 [Rhipicephalus microplus]